MRPSTLYRALDGTTGAVLIVLTLFLGWGFGINGLWWALWTVRGLGWLLGVLLIGKWIVCRVTGYSPPQHQGQGKSWPVVALAILTVLILAWVFTSWMNPRADVSFSSNQWSYQIAVLNYRENYIRWLPHTYDLTATRSTFWTYTALAGTFWAARDWFRGKSKREQLSEEISNGPVLPQRVRVWLWVLIVSALVMGVTGLLQKLDGTKALLWVLPWGKPTVANLPFGPYMYRGNAAQYFNLIWPVALGFWWHLRRSALARIPHAPMGGDPSIVLLPITAVLAACPAVTLSRGGIIISGLLLLASALGYSLVPQTLRRGPRWAIASVLSLASILAVVVAGPEIVQRFNRDDYQTLNGRTKIFEVAQRMRDDFRWLGSGPETIPSIYHLYRESAADSDSSEAYLHNDWMETIVTFGYLGSIPIFAALAAVPLIWWRGKGQPTSGVFSLHLALALVGMLIHAIFDFPFQITALVGTWLILAALLTVLAPPLPSRD